MKNSLTHHRMCQGVFFLKKIKKLKKDNDLRMRETCEG